MTQRFCISSKCWKISVNAICRLVYWPRPNWPKERRRVTACLGELDLNLSMQWNDTFRWRALLRVTEKIYISVTGRNKFEWTRRPSESILPSAVVNFQKKSGIFNCFLSVHKISSDSRPKKKHYIIWVFFGSFHEYRLPKNPQSQIWYVPGFGGGAKHPKMALFEGLGFSGIQEPADQNSPK